MNEQPIDLLFPKITDTAGQVPSAKAKYWTLKSDFYYVDDAAAAITIPLLGANLRYERFPFIIL